MYYVPTIFLSKICSYVSQCKTFILSQLILLLSKLKIKFDLNMNKKENINVRLTEAQKERWQEYADKNGFASISNLVRYAVEELVEGTFQGRRQTSNNHTELKKRLGKIEEKYNNVLEEQRELLKIIAKGAENKDKDEKLSIFQKELIYNLLEEKPRDEVDLDKLIPGLNEFEILAIINKMLELGTIKQKGNKYEVV